jgi:uncharacterized protein
MGPDPDRILVDTGPLVAIVDSNDFYHRICTAALAEMKGPLCSCWPVLTEAAWLLRSSPPSVQQLLCTVDSEFIEMLPLSGAEGKKVAAVMRRYSGMRPQLADAALVYLAEREGISTIFTLDRRDFSIYRLGRNRKFRLVPEIE